MQEPSFVYRWLCRLAQPKWLGRLAVCLGLATLPGGCGGDGGTTSPTPTTPQPTPTPAPQYWDVSFVGSEPPANGTLQLSAPNNTPVSLSVTFMVTVPRGQAGTYNWNTVLQMDLFADPAFISPGVTTGFQPVALQEGIQLITVTGFHTTNTTCYQPADMPATNESLDIDIREEGASQARNRPQVVGKRFDVTYALSCVP